MSAHDWQPIPEPVEGPGPIFQCTKCMLLKVGPGQPMMPCNPEDARPMPKRSDGELMHYRGQIVDEMTREELIDAVKALGRLLTQTQERALSTHEMYGRLREARVRNGY